MKAAKKLMAVLLAVLLMASLSVAVFADDGLDLSGHTYKAYQIFAGSQAENSANLAVSGWGSGINGGAFLAALKESTAFGTTSPFASCTDAAGVAAAMTGENWGDNSDNAKAFAKLAYQYKAGSGTTYGENVTLEAGYYLVVDSTSLSGTDTVRNLALLQLTNKGDFTIAAKVDIPSVIKKVKDVNDTTGEASDWQDSADWDIGDTIPFKLEATLPSDLANYPSYKLVFHDIECAGLTLCNTSDFKVYIGSSTTALTSGYSVKTTGLSAGETFEVIIDDVIASGGTAGAKVRVEYTATLNENAEIGSLGNPNEVYLEYSNNPNFVGSTTIEKDEKDYTVSGTEDNATIKDESEGGKTYSVTKDDGDKLVVTSGDSTSTVVDENTVTVTSGGETYTVTIDEGGNATVKNSSGETVENNDVAEAAKEAKEIAEVYDEAHEKSGSPIGPESRETGSTVHDKVIVFTYKFQANKTDGTNALPGAGFTLYKFIPGSGTDKLGDGESAVNGTWTVVTEKTTGEDRTTFEWVGIDDGTYKLVESTVPSGYNGMEPVIFVVSAAHDTLSDDPALTSLTGNLVSGTVFASYSDNILSADIVNKAGATLPETGGMGTTIFYVLGSVLVVGAAVLLITKKRMSVKD